MACEIFDALVTSGNVFDLHNHTTSKLPRRKMSKKEDGGLGKPSSSRVSNASKELYAYTPSWMTAAERTKLKARIRKIKKKEEGMWGMKKEEVTLVQSSVKGKDRDPLAKPEERKEKVLAGSFDQTGARRSEKDEFGNMSVILPDDGPFVTKGTPSSDGPDRPASTTSKHKSDRSGASERSPKKKGASSSHEKPSTPNRNNKESLSKKKSKEELTMTKERKKKLKHPKSDHANPSGNLVTNEKPRHARNTLEDHLWVTDFEHFDPRLYSFKTPEKLSTKKPVAAECPPFWVLNDHTVAVAWKLYCKEADRGDLGIVALQWSREFVSAMKDETGEYPIAIKHLLDAIEDGLIYRYSRSAEDSIRAHPRTDEISYASSDSVFKPPTEVSYTLKDIMSRNIPGRQSEAVQQASIPHTADASVVHKTAIPIYDGPHMNQRDILAFLQHRKMEQEARVKHAMYMEREIGKLLILAKDGKSPKLLSERKDHVDFVGEEDLKKPASLMSYNKSAESAASDKSLRSSTVHPSDSQAVAKKKKPSHPGVSIRNEMYPDTVHDSFLEKVQNKDGDWDKSSSPPLESSIKLSESLFNDSKTKHTVLKDGSKHDKAIENHAQYDSAVDRSKDSKREKPSTGSVAKKKSKNSLVDGRKSSKVTNIV